MTHRKKPFSNKQKRAQLQAKRQQRRDGECQKIWEKNSNFYSESPILDISENNLAVSGLRQEKSRIGKFNTKSPDEKTRLVSVFDKMTPQEIELNKRKCFLPIKRLSQKEAFETDYESYHHTFIDIIKRPQWSYHETKNQLEVIEKECFERWLDDIYAKYNHRELSFFEHNLEVWRQLWRVLEMSDILCLLVDIRHPMLHLSPSLYKHVVNDLKKSIVIVLTKVDLVSKKTVFSWRSYIQELFPQAVITEFSCYPREPTLLDDTSGYSLKKIVKKQRSRRYQSTGVAELFNCCKKITSQISQFDIDWDELILKYQEKEVETEEKADKTEEDKRIFPQKKGNENGGTSSEDEEIEDLDDDSEEEARECFYENLNVSQSTVRKSITIGMIGHPNVGKSTLVNSILGKTVTSVSSTPGHTKHFQTAYLTKFIRMCDCPGIVFPLIVPKPVQIVFSIYNIAQVQEPYTSIDYLAQRIPLEDILRLSEYKESFAENGQWSAWSICEAYAEMRGFHSAKGGKPDVYRAANYILRLCNTGRILLSMKPPGFFSSTKYETLACLEADKVSNESFSLVLSNSMSLLEEEEC